MERGAVAEYSCTTGLAYPANDVTVHATDQEGDTIDIINYDEEHQTEEKGVTTIVQFSFQVPDSARNVTLNCKSNHPAGDGLTSLHIPVLCKSDASCPPANSSSYLKTAAAT